MSDPIMAVLERMSLKELTDIMRDAQAWIAQTPDDARQILSEEVRLRYALFNIPKILDKRYNDMDSGDSRMRGHGGSGQAYDYTNQPQQASGGRQQRSQPPPQQQQPYYPNYPPYQQGPPPPQFRGDYQQPPPPPGYQGYQGYQGYPPQQGYPQYGLSHQQQEDLAQLMSLPPEYIARLPEDQRRQIEALRAQFGGRNMPRNY